MRPSQCLWSLCAWTICLSAACGEANQTAPSDQGALRRGESDLLLPLTKGQLLGSDPPTAVAIGPNAIVVASTSPKLTIYARGFARVEQQTFALPEHAQAVAIDGDTIAVGLPQQEQVEIFRRSGGTWAWVQTLTETQPYGNSTDASLFGFALALRGNTLAVAEPMRDDHAGRVLLFERTNGAFPTSPNKVIYGALYPDACYATTADEEFGLELTFMLGQPGADATLVVGKPGVGQGGCKGPFSGRAGQVFVFEQKAGVWPDAPTATLTPSDLSSHNFGHSLSASDGSIAVGQDAHAEVFRKVGASWTSIAELAVEGLQGQGQLPRVAFDGYVLAVSTHDYVTVYELSLLGVFRQTAQLVPTTTTDEWPERTLALARSSLVEDGVRGAWPPVGTLVVGVPVASDNSQTGAYVYRAIEIGGVP